MDRILTFQSNGDFTFRVESFGVYATSRSLSAYTEIRGKFETDGERLRFSPRVMITWDSFYGNPQPMVSDAPVSLFHDCTFTQSRGNLILNYTTYPADGPEPTVMVLKAR